MNFITATPHVTQQWWTMFSLQCLGMLLMTPQMVSWGISSLTWIRVSVKTWTVCDRTWHHRFYWYITSHWCSIGLGHGKERATQCYQCFSHPETAYVLRPHEAGHCPAPGGEPRVHCTSLHMSVALRISSQYLTAVRVPFAMTLKSVWPSKNKSPQTINDPSPNQSCWMMLQAALSLQLLHPLSRLSHVLSVNLLSSVKRTGCHWRTCQFWCPLVQMQIKLHDAELWPEVPLVDVGPSCHLHWVRNMHKSNLPEVIFTLAVFLRFHLTQKVQILVLLLDWCPSVALSSSPCVMACLLLSPLCSWDCAGRHSNLLAA